MLFGQTGACLCVHQERLDNTYLLKHLKSRIVQLELSKHLLLIVRNLTFFFLNHVIPFLSLWLHLHSAFGCGKYLLILISHHEF